MILVKPVHDRMPCILERRHFGAWIDRDVQAPAELAPMPRPFAADRMLAHSVSPLVNSPRNDDPRCHEPAQPSPRHRLRLPAHSC